MSMPSRIESLEISLESALTRIAALERQVEALQPPLLMPDFRCTCNDRLTNAACPVHPL